MWKHKNFINLQLCATFKHFYDAGTIGTGAFKFRHYSQQEPTPSGYADCLTFVGKESEFTLKATTKTWDGTLEWSTDHNTWTTLAGTEAMQSANKVLYLRGKNSTFYSNNNSVKWQLSEKADCIGNIQTLLDWENPPVSVPTESCYKSMFDGCTNLTSAPDLPATTLEHSCYQYMFSGCISLTSAPELPATTLADSCYYSMFRWCENLTAAPELPAPALVYGCYSDMFYSCSKLKVNTTSGKKIFTCPPDASDKNVEHMFVDTGGTFTGTPTSGTTYYYTE